MSDTSQGPGWWQASDGKCYSPELHADNRLPPPPPPELLDLHHGGGDRHPREPMNRILRFVVVVAVGGIVIAFIGNAFDSHQSATTTTTGPAPTSTTEPLMIDGCTIEPKTNCAADLQGTHIVNRDGSGVSLMKANLTGANLSRTTLWFADLSNANLSSANMSGADLGPVAFGGANLTGANLSAANVGAVALPGTNLTDADLRGATHAAGTTWADAKYDNTICPDGTNSDNDGGTCFDNGHLGSG
jgi:hypothetical protein